LGDLAAKIALISPGQKISYITDVVYNQSNAAKIVELVEASDHLFIEAVFLDTHRDMAAEKQHLTARQAGQLAATAGVKQFSIFHFSPRYTGEDQLLKEEARVAFERQRADDPSLSHQGVTSPRHAEDK
jgi:ribonuclease Z